MQQKCARIFSRRFTATVTFLALARVHQGDCARNVNSLP